MRTLAVLRTSAYEFVYFVYALDQLSADTFMIPYLFLHADLTLHISYDLGVHQVVPACCFLDALDQGMIDQAFHYLFPPAALGEDLVHHLTFQAVGQQAQHFDHL